MQGRGLDPRAPGAGEAVGEAVEEGEGPGLVLLRGVRRMGSGHGDGDRRKGPGTPRASAAGIDCDTI